MLAAIWFGASSDKVAGTPDVNQIVQQSGKVTEADRQASPDYDYSETDLGPDGSTKTYAVRMLYGSPYSELIAVDGKPLPEDAQQQEKKKLQEEISRRQRESPAENAHRIAEFQREQNRDKRFIEELTRAFTFKLLGEQQRNGREVYVVQASPLPGYHPPDITSRVLTGMRGRMWIDKQTYQWVAVEAEVVHPVSIEGFLAKVEPGTRFYLEKTPVEDNIWMPKHFRMTSNARVLSVFRHHHHEDETYFGYHKAAQKPQPAGREDDLRGLESSRACDFSNSVR